MANITSGTLIDNIDQHFRVRAGPGAGKTHWLVNHIRQVVQKSDKLAHTSKIACISHTNVAAVQIMQRLGAGGDKVVTSTIHSFLYQNVVKPYLHLVRDRNGNQLVDFSRVDGHEEHRPIRSLIIEWLQTAASKPAFAIQKLVHSNFVETCRYLQRVRWQVAIPRGDLKIVPPRAQIPMPLPVNKLEDYKYRYWQVGIIDHDDVLYFSYRILSEFPLIRSVLAARFPYFFVDEFQDTNEVQASLIGWLAEAGACIGVIGDEEQAIYSFHGASSEAFSNFALPEFADYTITDNRRSTNKIVSFINRIRDDGVIQDGLRGVEGEPVTLYVGNLSAALKAVYGLTPPPLSLAILARNNDQVNHIRCTASAHDNTEVWRRFYDADSDRARFFENYCVACEQAMIGNYATAIHSMVKAIRSKHGQVKSPLVFSGSISDLDKRGVSVLLLEFFASNHVEFKNKTLLEIYSITNEKLGMGLSGLSLKNFKSGKFKEFAAATSFGHLMDALHSVEDDCGIRTIHKSKGAEFDHVLFYMEDLERISHLLFSDDYRGKEEKRVSYVAVSRAKDRLFLYTPEVTEKVEQAFRALGGQIEHFI